MSNYELFTSLTNATVRIRLTNDGLPVAEILSAENEESDKRLCTGLDEIRAMLEAFCLTFDRLGLEFKPLSGYDIKPIIQTLVGYANRYCSTVPQYFVLERNQSVDHTIGEFTAKNVLSVQIDRPEQLANFSINRQFPRVERLYIEVSEPYAIDEHLPHLEHFVVNRYNTCENFDFATFAAANPQIGNLWLVLCEGIQHLRELNELWPNLAELYYVPSGLRGNAPTPNATGEVRFANVKRYTINLRQTSAYEHTPITNSYLSSVRFDRLESLTYITSDDKNHEAQLAFVGQYKEVRSLDYHSYELSYEDAARLVGSLPNLKEFTFKPNGTNAEIACHEGALRLMTDTNLETIRLWTNNKILETIRSLKLPDKWVLVLHENDSNYELVSVLFTIVTFTRSGEN